jgi:hypothetical protein
MNLRLPRAPRPILLIATVTLVASAGVTALLPEAASAPRGQPDPVAALQRDADALVAAGLPG